jgi:hypothetical protein
VERKSSPSSLVAPGQAAREVRVAGFSLAGVFSGEEFAEVVNPTGGRRPEESLSF